VRNVSRPVAGSQEPLRVWQRAGGALGVAPEHVDINAAPGKRGAELCPKTRVSMSMRDEKVAARVAAGRLLQRERALDVARL
jgi:hypothetical protein